MDKRKRNIRQNHFLQLLLVIVGIVIINLVSNMYYDRYDLTSEKRYTLSEATKEVLNELDDIVFFRVYLEGEFPAGFKRLRRETKELLDEFRAINKNILYEFINPSASENAEERNDTYQLLVQQGLNPTNLQVKTKTGMDQQVIFPGAILSYRNKEIPIELLDAQINVPPEAVLNNSIQNLEFKFADAIHKLSRKVKPRVAFIEGHGELNDRETFDITVALQADYIVERVEIDGQVNSLVNRVLDDSVSNNYNVVPKFAAIIIAKPDSVFSGKDKFIIDQYIMYGGKVMWLIDPVMASMDSLQKAGSTVAVANILDIQDQLFSYGVRLNTDIVMDLNALPIPLNTGQIGSQPQFDFFPWFYFPVVTPFSQHPIVRNLNTIKIQFVSSIDTLRLSNIRKTILLKTSTYSRVIQVPAVVSLATTQQQLDERLYPGPPKTIAVLLEGNFTSNFKNRMPPSLANAKEIGFRDLSEPTRMIVVSDGDIIKNQFHIPNGYPLPLGYDQYTRETFGNKAFILNAMNYLTDGPGLISIRSRELKLRLLDKTKINKQRVQWQVINLLVPVLIIVIMGSILIWIRKRKYTRS